MTPLNNSTKSKLIPTLAVSIQNSYITEHHVCVQFLEGGRGETSLPCLLSLLMTCVMSTGALAAILAFCSSSCCRRMMGLRLGRLFFAFCSNWASLRRPEGSIHSVYGGEKDKVKIKLWRVMDVVVSRSYRDTNISQRDEKHKF